MTDEPIAFAAAPPERVELPGGCALVRPRPDLVPSGVDAINASLDHLRPWMDWAQEAASLDSLGTVYAEGSAGWDARRDFLYVLVDEHDAVVGGSGLHPRLGPGALEIGYWIHVDHSGRGLGTELARAATAAGFAVPGVERIRIQCASANRRSARIPEKLGYELAETVTEEGGREVQRWLVDRATWEDPAP